MIEDAKQAKSVRQEDTGVELGDFTINSEIVLKVTKGIFNLQKLLIDPTRVKKTFDKLKQWFESFEGNDEEGAKTFVLNQVVEAIR